MASRSTAPLAHVIVRIIDALDELTPAQRERLLTKLAAKHGLERDGRPVR